MNFNRSYFSACIHHKLKKDNIPFRKAAIQIGISTSSLFFISDPKRIDLPGLYHLYNTCAWMGMTPNDFFITNKENEQRNIQ